MTDDAKKAGEEREMSTNSEIQRKSSFDVFLWANQVDEVKNNVSVELFLFNKNYTPYRVKYSEKLTASVKAMFMSEAIQYVIKEADKGLEQREYEKSDGEDKVIYRTDLSNVTRADTLLNLIEHESKDIDYFSDNEYQFKKIKGILAKFTYPDNAGEMKSFYIAKGLAASSALKGATSWELDGESFEPFSAEIAIKMPEDNQVAIVDGNVVIFNQSTQFTIRIFLPVITPFFNQNIKRCSMRSSFYLNLIFSKYHSAFCFYRVIKVSFLILL